MVTSIRQLASSIKDESGDYLAIDKRSLALDALSKLTCQFAKRPDCRELIDVLILTISGQFAVPHAFAAVRNPSSRTVPSIFVGTGRFQSKHSSILSDWAGHHVEYFLAHPEPARVADLANDPAFPPDIATLKECDVRLIAPFVHGDTFIGVVGLGEKVTRKPYEDSEIALLATLANTITPFIANSFLFMEIASLNEWYRKILDSVKQGVFVFNGDDLLENINAAGWSILRTFNPSLPPPEELIGAHMEKVFPDVVFNRWTPQFGAGRRGHGELSLKKLVAKNNDIERIFNVGLTTIQSDSKSHSNLIITLDDVTFQKISEQKLFELEKLAMQGVMASSISHELNNFLALILGGVELAQMALKKGNNEKIDASLTKLRNNAQKMERFTAGLTDYNRLDAQKKPTSLNDLITDVLTFVLVQRKFTRLNINTDLDPAIPVLSIDADQIAQLLLNLMNNAADAIREAGRSSGGNINVVSRLEDDRAVLEVSDNGIGMNEHTREKLFRAHFTTKPDGHGYGLVTCAKIITNHEATVEVASEEGKGTTFTFGFPLVAPVDSAESEK